jgi:hypothetical protein
MPVPYILSDPYLDANFAWTKNGTVTSIGLTSTDLTVSGSPVTVSGNITANLTTTGVAAATYGSKSQVAQFAVDTKGRITSAANVTIAPSVIFSQTASVTVANSVAETTLFGTGVGSLVIAANTMQVGSSFSGTAIGPHSATGSPTIRLRVYLNSTVILDTGIVTSGNSTNATWEFRGLVTCRTTGATGTIMAQGFYLESAGGPNLFGMVNSAPITIDTTINQTINFTVQWGTASVNNTITATNVNIQGWGPPQ